ncbi:MAG TPA: MBOAT family protein [Firmicutes bacterium]|nr:MBOAT family protein [Bacillota bacterium]
MGFHTPQFLILVFIAFVLFAVAKGRYKLVVLATFDALFYLYAGIMHLALLVGASLVSYYSGIMMTGRRKKLAVVIGVGLNLLNLAFFKYYHFVLENLSRFATLPPGLISLKTILPIGISFYTFQLVAYLIDVYRGDLKPIKSFLEFWVFISFFGQVIAGPIMRASAFAPQVASTSEWEFDSERFKKAVLLFTLGLMKKLLIADSLAPLVDKYFSRGSAMSSVDIWIAAYLFGFQVYYDFSAYSDMALGVGHLFGYDLAQNFRCPYLSENPSEFWSRWHITLSTWIRDYLYIPMGGSRNGFTRGLVAVVLSMCISGLWHGASWTFVLWGLYHGLLSAGHRIWEKTLAKRIRGGKLIRCLNVFLFLQLTMIGWVFFRVQLMSDLVPLLRKMITFSDFSAGPHVAAYLSLVVCLYGLHIAEYVGRRSTQIYARWSQRVPLAIRGLGWASIAFLICLFIRPKPNAFIYFQF